MKEREVEPRPKTAGGPAGQKFAHGDVVRVADDLGSWMQHFESGCEVVIDHSYREKYGGEGDRHSYSVIFPETGATCAWYQEDQLTFIRHGGQALIDEIETARKAREVYQTNLEWIIANWKSIRESVPGPTIGALMGWIGITNPWGSQGEGLAYFNNARMTFNLLDPTLSAGDVEEVKKLIAELNPVAPWDAGYNLRPADRRDAPEAQPKGSNPHPKSPPPKGPTP
jgi:hypothetical protein